MGSKIKTKLNIAWSRQKTALEVHLSQILGPCWTKLGTKIGPSWSQVGPRWDQVGAKLGQDEPKLGQVGAKLSQVGAKMDQVGAK